MKKQHMLMGAGMLVGVWLAFFSDKTPDSDVAEAIVRPAAADKVTGTAQARTADTTRPATPPLTTAATTTKTTSRSERLIPILALEPRSKLISIGHVDLNGKKVANASTIFGIQSWVPPPPVEVKPLHPPPPPPPMAPPLKLKFIGKKLEDGVWEVYLANGESSYVVQKNSVIDNIYRVDTITPNLLNLTYLPLNLPQRLNIKGL